MNKKFLLISALYALPCFAKDQLLVDQSAIGHAEEPITLEIPLLGTLDNSGVIKVDKIAEFRGKVHGLINHVFKAKDHAYILEEFVNLEIEGGLDPELQKKAI